jgi:Fe-S-cluster containining protein
MLPFSPNDFALHGDDLDPETTAFYREHLTPVPRREGRLAVKHWSSGWSEVFVDGRWEFLPAWYYRCDRYDPVAKACTAYDERPEMCSGYPWHDEPVDPNKSLPPQCAYNADVGRAVLSAEVDVELRRSGSTPESVAALTMRTATVASAVAAGAGTRKTPRSDRA